MFFSAALRARAAILTAQWRGI
uniref:NADH:ubiquinone oxidoreductase core subunit V2 n=1 Tax=Saimiri boliviensis boliviensis TaxID=39432 RepID=A0A2K6V4N8_SAIBB